MKKFRWLSLLLVLVLFTTLLLSGCGNSSSPAASGEATGTADADDDYDQITFAFFCNLFIPQDMQMIEDALNEQLREKIHAEVELVPLSLEMCIRDRICCYHCGKYIFRVYVKRHVSHRIVFVAACGSSLQQSGIIHLINT